MDVLERDHPGKIMERSNEAQAQYEAVIGSFHYNKNGNKSKRFRYYYHQSSEQNPEIR